MSEPRWPCSSGLHTSAGAPSSQTLTVWAGGGEKTESFETARGMWGLPSKSRECTNIAEGSEGCEACNRGFCIGNPSLVPHEEDTGSIMAKEMELGLEESQQTACYLVSKP